MPVLCRLRKAILRTLTLPFGLSRSSAASSKCTRTFPVGREESKSAHCPKLVLLFPDCLHEALIGSDPLHLSLQKHRLFFHLHLPTFPQESSTTQYLGEV